MLPLKIYIYQHMKVEALTLQHPHRVISSCNFSCRVGSWHHSPPLVLVRTQASSSSTTSSWAGLYLPHSLYSPRSLGISAVRILCHSPWSLSICSHPYCTEQLAPIGMPWTAGFSKWQSNWGCSASYCSHWVWMDKSLCSCQWQSRIRYRLKMKILAK